MKYFGLTDPGRQRENNEDVFLVDADLCAAIVADGMGGQNCGEVGSALTVETVADYLRMARVDENLEAVAMAAIGAANRRVFEAARVRRECRGMGSTVVLALWRGEELLVANAGDSRAYLCRGGHLRQLSYDQNFANELRSRLGLSDERVRSMAGRNVLTMAIGVHERVEPRLTTERLEPGDQVLLCSDGLYGPVEDRAIAGVLGEAGLSLESKVRRLVEEANRRGGPDNVTVVLVEP